MTGTSLVAGAAQADITPPLGVELSGYGPYEKRVATEVLDPLYARALWLESEGTALAIITADLVGIDSTIRDAVAQRLHDECGVDEQNVLVAASHTHSGPATQLIIGWGERDPAYMDNLPDRLAQVALEARKARQPAAMGACRVRIEGVGVNREQPDIGPVDNAAQLMKVDHADGSPLAVIFNFGAHAVTRYPYTGRISADWPGLVGACLEVELPGAVPLFLQGPCGDVNAHHMIFTRRDRVTQQKVCDMRAGDAAQRLCSQIIPALKQLKTSLSATFASSREVIQLPCNPPPAQELQKVIDENQETANRFTLEEFRPLHERLEDETPEEKAWREARFALDSARYQLKLVESPPYIVEAPVQVLRIGQAAIVGWPGEIFMELGLELRRRSPAGLTFVASFANGNVGYIPTPQAYEFRGEKHEYGKYPTQVTPLIYGRLPFQSDVGKILVNETLRLLHKQVDNG